MMVVIQNSTAEEALMQIDTDLAAGIEGDKIPPQTVATSALDALEAGQSEAIVDEFSRGVKAALHDDQTLLYPAIEEQFAAAAAS